MDGGGAAADLGPIDHPAEGAEAVSVKAFPIHSSSLVIGNVNLSCAWRLPARLLPPSCHVVWKAVGRVLIVE